MMKKARVLKVSESYNHYLVGCTGSAMKTKKPSNWVGDCYFFYPDNFSKVFYLTNEEFEYIEDYTKDEFRFTYHTSFNSTW